MAASTQDGYVLCAGYMTDVVAGPFSTLEQAIPAWSRRGSTLSLRRVIDGEIVALPRAEMNRANRIAQRLHKRVPSSPAAPEQRSEAQR